MNCIFGAFESFLRKVLMTEIEIRQKTLSYVMLQLYEFQENYYDSANLNSFPLQNKELVWFHWICLSG